MKAAPKSGSIPRAGGAEPIVDVVARTDYAIFADRLADDVVFRSPVARFKFRGRAIASALFETLVKESDPGRWQVKDYWDVGDTHFVSISTSVHGHELDLLLMTRLNKHQQISEVTAYARPMASIAIFPAFVYPHLVARFRGRARAAVVRLLFRPLPRILSVGVAAGLRLGQPPEAVFDVKPATPDQSSAEKPPTPEQSLAAKLPTSEQSPAANLPTPEKSPAAPAGPRSPFRRL